MPSESKYVSSIKQTQRHHLILIWLVGLLLFSGMKAVVATPSIALGYEPKYRSNFTHFDYVNPDAPKGGTLVLSGFGNFDSLNPFILKGVSADGLTGLIFETLMVQTADEPYSLYAHLAEDIQLAKDKLSVTFRLNKKARFSDNSPVLAEDVKLSFDLLKSDKGHPRYRFYWTDIKQAVVIDAYTIRFDFVRINPELHLIAAQIPVFSRNWVGDADFSKLSRKLPIGSGPYIVGKYDLGKTMTYTRNPKYWARDRNTRRGMFNFDKVMYKYYKDSTIQLEALKAGEFDFILVNHSKQWARDYVGPQFDSGRIKKDELTHKNNAGMQGFVFNTRREIFKDKRVRRAFALAFDFAWSNKNLFYEQYVRCDSYFSNSEMASQGLPQGEELALLEKYRSQLPKEVFTTIWHPGNTDTPGALRNNLLEAQALLNAAGWRVKDGVLQNKQGVPLEISFMLAQKGFERILGSYEHNLKRLGIKMHYRTVDVALYISRLRTFDFDMVVSSYSQPQSPGNELYNLWHSKAAVQEGSRNYMGVNDPVVDALIDEVVFAPNRKRVIIAARALDRVLLHGEYLVPNWYIGVHRIAYWDKFAYPKISPLYYEAEPLMMQTWWDKSLDVMKSQ